MSKELIRILKDLYREGHADGQEISEPLSFSKAYDAEQAILALMDKRFEDILKLIELLEINACDLSREGLPPFHIDIIHWMTKIFKKKDEIRARWEKKC